jgi:hypothetical protein
VRGFTGGILPAQITDRRAGASAAYIPESQDRVNEFSFWLRYDEFVPLPPNTVRDPNEVYTEEQG